MSEVGELHEEFASWCDEYGEVRETSNDRLICDVGHDTLSIGESGRLSVTDEDILAGIQLDDVMRPGGPKGRILFHGEDAWMEYEP